jgi:hypothetical protein
MRFHRFLISVLGFTMLFGIPVSASTIVYCNSGCGANNQAAFNNAITAQNLFFPTGLENFSADTSGTDSAGLADPSGASFFGFENTGTSGIQKGVTVSGSVLEQNPFFLGQNTALELQAPAGILAIAMNVSIDPSASSGNPCIEVGVTAPTFNLSNCNNQISISSSSDTEFIGVISSAAISNIFVGYAANSGGQSGQLEIQSFELGVDPPPDVPEVASLILIGTGLTAMGVMRRRRNPLVVLGEPRPARA